MQNYYRHNILQPVGFFVLVFLALSIGLLNRFRKIAFTGKIGNISFWEWQR